MDLIVFVFRRWIASEQKITLEDNNTITNGSEVINLSDNSFYYQKKGRETSFYTMEDIYYIYSIQKVKYVDYMNECKRIGKTSVLFVDFKSIYEWLIGTVQELEGLKVPTESVQEVVEEVVPQIEEKPEPVPIKETKLQFEYETLRTIDSMVIGNYDFSDLLNVKINKTNDQSQNRDQKPRKFHHPIILVPLTTDSCINRSNIESFLKDFKWIPTEECTDENSFTIVHVDDIYQKEKRFSIVCDSSELLDGDWEHVVAIFLSKFKWQISDYKIPNDDKADPARLFSKYLGIYVMFEGENPPDHIANYKVSVFKIGRNTRYLDQQIISQIWSIIENKYTEIKRNLK